jgi:hypothetical protein
MQKAAPKTSDDGEQPAEVSEWRQRTTAGGRGMLCSQPCSGPEDVQTAIGGRRLKHHGHLTTLLARVQADWCVARIDGGDFHSTFFLNVERVYGDE